MVWCICGRPRAGACVPVSRGDACVPQCRACVVQKRDERVCESVWLCVCGCARAPAVTRVPAAAVVEKGVLCGRKPVNTTWGYGFARIYFVCGETGARG